MKIDVEEDAQRLNLKLKGRLDTTTAPQLDLVIKEKINGITDLQLDFKELEYISSAGLRVILSALKRMKSQGTMVIRNVREEIMEVFTITGFADILTIE